MNYENVALELRRKAKAIEFEIKLNFDKYNYIDTSIIDDSFSKCQELLQQLSEVVHSLQSLPPSIRNDNVVALHKENLKNYVQIFESIKNNMVEKMNYENASNTVDVVSTEEYTVNIQRLIKDTDSLQRSHQQADQFIRTGEQVKRVIVGGTKVISDASNRVQETLTMFSKFDVIFRTIKKIKLKGTIIIGILISACLCLLFLAL